MRVRAGCRADGPPGLLFAQTLADFISQLLANKKGAVFAQGAFIRSEGETLNI
jgi:hypothetical protein